MFGEKALLSDVGVREVSARAIDSGYCLSISKYDFIDKTYSFEQNKKAQRMSFISSLSFAADWSFEKMTHFNTELGQMLVLPYEVVFDIGSPSEVFYIVKSGELLVEAIVTIEESNSFPISVERWESCST